VDRTRARQALGVAPAQPLVVVTPGGGEDGHALIDQALQAAVLWPCAQRPRIHFVCGPELAEDLRATVHARAAALPGVSVQDFCDDMMSLLAAADVVLAMGGYNTVCELLTLRRRAVLVPRVQPGTEQLIRAERMAARGLLQVLHPAQVNAQRLQAALQDEIDAQARGVQRPALQSVDGLGEVTRHLFTLLDHTPALPPALSTADSAFMPFPTLGAGPALDRREALC
jgi:predicted glycosyltransferase